MTVNLTQKKQVLISFGLVLCVIMNLDPVLEFVIFNILLSARSLQSQKVTTAMFSCQFYLQVVFPECNHKTKYKYNSCCWYSTSQMQLGSIYYGLEHLIFKSKSYLVWNCWSLHLSTNLQNPRDNSGRCMDEDIKLNMSAHFNSWISLQEWLFTQITV